MDAIEALLTRRSVREFTGEPVSAEQIETMLCAAMHAPSACNQQPWHFITVTSREQLNAIAGVHPFAQMLKQAPLAIIVCADLTLETCPGNWVIALSGDITRSAATMNTISPSGERPPPTKPGEAPAAIRTTSSRPPKSSLTGPVSAAKRWVRATCRR